MASPGPPADNIRTAEATPSPTLRALLLLLVEIAQLVLAVALAVALGVHGLLDDTGEAAAPLLGAAAALPQDRHIVRGQPPAVHDGLVRCDHHSNARARTVRPPPIMSRAPGRTIEAGRFVISASGPNRRNRARLASREAGQMAIWPSGVNSVDL
jgi:hypothetical protein